MEFKYEKRFENNENWYTVGIIRGLIKDEEIYAVEIMDPAGKEMCDPDEWSPGNVAVAVFGITEAEYNMFSEDIKAFDELVQKLKRDIPKDRMFAERNCVRKSDRKATIDENNEFKQYMEAKIKKAVPNAGLNPKELIEQLLNAEKICVAYSSVTARPVLNVVNDKANLIMTLDEALMDKFVESQKNIYKKVFLKSVINSENEDSVFNYFYKMGINMLGFLLPDNRVLNMPMEALIKSESFKSKKLEGIYNPVLERSVTCLYQLLGTVKDEDKNNENFKKNTNYLDIKIMEEALGAKFILGQKAKKLEGGKVEFALSVVERKETGEKLIPAATCDEEFFVQGEGFEKISVSYDQLKDVVEKSGVDGFVVNCRSKCAFKFTKQKMEQVEKFRAWRDEQIKKAEEKKASENSEEN